MKNHVQPKAAGAAVVVAYILMIAVNAMATLLPINNMTTGEVSDRYGSLFTPAGITFSIWGVIYVLLLLFAVYQTGLVRKLTVQESKIAAHVRWPFVLSCALNAAWIVLWHYGLILLSLIDMLALLAVLTVIYLRIRSTQKPPVTKNEILFLMAPFSVYLGWITVAAIANAAAFLISAGWEGWGLSQSTWTTVMILIAVLVTLLVQRRYKDLLFTAVVVWALAGILIKHITVYKMAYTLILVTVVMSIAAVLIGVVLIFSRKRRVRRKAHDLKYNRRKKR